MAKDTRIFLQDEQYIDSTDLKHGNKLLSDILNSSNDTGWQSIAYQNTYSQYETGYAPFSFRKINNRVFLKGMIKSSIANPIGYYAMAGILPVGSRPKENIYLLGSESGNALNVSVQPNGEIRVFNKTANSWLSLDGINFFTD